MVSQIRDFLIGKKTYLIAITGVVLAILQHRGVFVVPQEVWLLMGAAGAAAIRAGVKSSMEGALEDLEEGEK
jgi:hypothetical protein